MPPLELIGALIRSERIKRGLTQQRAAKAAGVSRKQWCALEYGQNVSVVFLRMVASSLGLRTIPLGEHVEANTGGGRIDLLAVLTIADDLAALIERLRGMATDAALPPSEWGDDAAAIEAFVHGRSEISPEEGVRVRRAMQRLATDVARGKPEAQPAAPKRARRRRSRED